MTEKSKFTEGFPIETEVLLNGIVVFYQEISYEGYCCDEFSETIEQNSYFLFDASENKMTEIKDHNDWKRVYNFFPKNTPKEFVNSKKWVWSKMINSTPYAELTAYQQEKRDNYEGNYPNPKSKYFKNITKEILKEIIFDFQLELGQNLNDWTMYKDRPNERCAVNMQKKITELQKHIS